MGCCGCFERTAGSSLTASPKISENNLKHHRIKRRRFKTHLLIKGLCLCRKRMDDKPAYTNQISCADGAQCDIAKQRPSPTFPTPGMTHGKPCQDDDRNRIGHATTKFTCHS